MILLSKEHPCEGIYNPLRKRVRFNNESTLTPHSRLEEVTRQLDRIKRAKSHHEDGPLSPGSSHDHRSGPQSATPGEVRSESVFAFDAATAFGLDRVENEYAQVAPQSLGSYSLSSADIVMLFRKYAFCLDFCFFLLSWLEIRPRW